MILLLLNFLTKRRKRWWRRTTSKRMRRKRTRLSFVAKLTQKSDMQKSDMPLQRLSAENAAGQRGTKIIRGLKSNCGGLLFFFPFLPGA